MKEKEPIGPTEKCLLLVHSEASQYQTGIDVVLIQLPMFGCNAHLKLTVHKNVRGDCRAT